MITKNPFCTPRLRPATAARKTSRLSPMSLLDRLREAVFRLIMLSALSKGSNDGSRRRSSPKPSHHYYYPNNDPHHSEAVAECIEFIKKSATTTGSRDSTTGAGGYSDDAVEQPSGIPSPVL